jgi:hypothetical protein
MATDASSARTTVPAAPDSTGAPVHRRRRGSRRAAAGRSERTRLRALYFALASLWGFLIGTATLLFGFSLGGVQLELSPLAIIAMSAAVVLAVVGGMIAARAYRDASRRRR